MIERQITPTLRRRLSRYPAVALVGARQAGKTTLARSIGGAYFDLEQEPDRLRLDLQWDSLCDGRRLIILDEAQSWPEVFPRLRGAIDRDRRRNGRFLLLGSVSPSLMVQVSESLAGRLSLVELSPFLITEVRRSSLSNHWRCGGHPDGGVRSPNRFPQWQKDYLELLVQRDLPNWGLPAKPQTTRRLLHMIAAVHGQLWNASAIGQSLGISYATVNSYLDYLVGAFLVRRLLPFLPNLRKRLVRSPKVYWRDSGLLHAILGLGADDDLLDRPWVGASWEAFVVEQIIGTLDQSGQPIEPYFLRTSDGYEIDLILERNGQLWAIEVKLTTSPTTGDFRRLEKIAKLVGAHKWILISQTRRPIEEQNRISCSLPWFLERLVP